MRMIIEGRIYDTETATEICDVSAPGYSRGDFRYEETQLYRSPRGQFFIAGTGGPLSRWWQREGDSGKRGGSGLRLVDADDAREMCEQHASPDIFIKVFGQPEEG